MRPISSKTSGSWLSVMIVGAALVTGAYLAAQKNATAAQFAKTSLAVSAAVHGKPSAMPHAKCRVGKGPMAAAHGKRVAVEGSLLDGGHVSTAKWKGKVVVIDFWATWCPWCRAEMPAIEKMYGQYHGHGLEIVGVPLSDTAAAVRPYLKSNPKAAWPEIFDKGAGNAALAQKLGVSAFPAQCVIDRHGVLRYTVVGASQNQLGTDMQKLSTDVRKLLSKGNGHR